MPPQRRPRPTPKPGEPWNPKKHANRSRTPPALMGTILAEGRKWQGIFQKPGKLGKFTKIRPRPHETREQFAERIGAQVGKDRARPIGYLINPGAGSEKAIGMIHQERRNSPRRYRKPKPKK